MGTMLLKIKLNLIKSHLHKEVARSKENTMYSEKILITRIPMLKLSKKKEEDKVHKIIFALDYESCHSFCVHIF